MVVEGYQIACMIKVIHHLTELLVFVLLRNVSSQNDCAPYILKNPKNKGA